MTRNVLYRCTEKTVNRFATVVPFSVIMSSVVNDRRQVLFFFFTNNLIKILNILILSDTFSISLLECTVSEM